MPSNRLLLILLSVSILAIALSYFYIDRQVVWFLVAHRARDYRFLKFFADSIPYFIGTLIFFYYLYFFIRQLFNSKRALSENLLISCNATTISIFLKSSLKFLFGRYWIATFQCNNLSLINDQVYGFNWFKSGTDYGSFPSGHTAFIFAFVVSMWLLVPRLRWLWGLLASLVVMGQIGMYYHFVSDVIGGAVLGSLIGYCSVYYVKHQRSVMPQQ